ncbi:propionate CoA-transferase [Streptomyces sulfonofaciens]|uniref:Propionate CoA-transferase n=1 Tax=Streptomyces sulfonofaciens TaxID=68272 RepID=A0A919GPF1_9ACTN|nr:malonate decarboxylase subunit alpha [Streptomyces sulfonofaciens]GHH88327.1 propionate CoA-transferase [Streptomyces sulfonofaciens]
MIPVEAAPSGRATHNLLLTPGVAAGLIRDGATVAVGGTGSLLQVPETLLAAVEQRWGHDSSPRGLTVVHVMGLGDHQGRGIDHIAVPGLVDRFIGSHFVLSPRQQAAIAGNEIEAVALPAGTISLLYREIAARRPGLFTDIGLDTFVDPRRQWGRMNARTRTGLSEVVTIRGEEWLFYPRFDIDVALLRASEADTDGNISMDDEAAFGDNLAIAQAARNSGGLVIVEVKKVVERGAIPAGRVRVPAPLVDHVVVTDYPNQTPITVADPRRTGVAANTLTEVEALPFDHRKVVARRAASELHDGDLANLGVGMANGISYVALEEGFLDRFTLTVEQGVFGGVPGVGLDSGTAINPSAIVDMPSQFDLYDGGALDFAGLAFAEIDQRGNVNVAAAGGRPIGPGGFIDISQKARTIVFCGTLRGGGLKVQMGDGRLAIETEGRYPKFVREAQYVSFSAERAHRRGQRVLYVTERAVFALTAEGVELLEIAPGMDLRRDVLDRMEFTPLMRSAPKVMDRRLFLPAKAGIGPRPRRPKTERQYT